MENLSNVRLSEYEQSKYKKPRTIYYKQNGKQLKCDILAQKNSIAMIVHNITRNVLVLEKQFRPAVYLHQIPFCDRKLGPVDLTKYPAKLGVTYEFCGGLEDKNISTEETAKEELLEECGYKMESDQLEKICTIRNHTATSGARTTWYYCKVSDEMKVSEGGGNIDEGENIEVVEMSVEDAVRIGNSEHAPCPANFMFGLYWFLDNKYDNKPCTGVCNL
nr:unnamed protein product [Callosobruchus analis]